ncbi:MAG: hypothetical protein H0V61_10440 [Chitinophagales bacterium]|nr:hypothetical protein [Chitinophagales bacterium]
MHFVSYVLISCVVLIIASCQKEKHEFVFTQLNSGTINDLNSLWFTDDMTGYTCGGDRYYQGNILKTTDAGATWFDQGAAIDKALYSLFFVNNDTAFMGGYDGKIFRTYNAGDSWALYQNYVYQPVRGIFMVNDNLGFCCGGNGFKTGFILHTYDGGNQWQTDTFSMEWRSIFFVDNNHGFVAGYGSIFETTNGGLTWQPTPASGDFFQSLYFSSPQTGFAVGYEGTILKTIDGGKTWEKKRNGNDLLQGTKHFKQIIFRDQTTGYIVGEKGCMLKTENSGESWNEVINAPDVNLNAIFLVEDGGYICGEGGKIYRFLE